MKNEVDNNISRIQGAQNLLANKDDNISRVCIKLNEAFQAISQHKYNLNKLDSELGYFENLND